ncbi:MAG: hypothetical protein KDK70_42650, partial [Myxococcales bacterium]|nr:hypothetical protein [Myxococcales bacterium]
AKDYAAAIEHYTEALRHQPAAKTYFNLGVCHHRLMSATSPGSPAYELHRGGAVDAYNRYLQATPEAPDRQEVAEMIRSLGGTPLSAEAPEPWTIELVEPDDVPDPPSFDDEGDDRPTPEIPPLSAEAPRKPSPGPLLRPRWGLGVSLPVMLINPGQAARSDELRPVPTLGLGLRGHGYLGSKGGVLLGGELALATQPLSAKQRHRMSLAFVALAVEYRRMMGQGRWEIGGGGSIGLGSQALFFDGDARLRCTKDREASRRNGLWASARLYVAALLGQRRNHALTLRVGPGLGVYGPGSVPLGMDAAGMTCEGEPSAFETFGIDEGPAMVVGVDLGYAPRF